MHTEGTKYGKRLPHLIVLSTVTLLILTACGSTSTSSQVLDATIQTPSPEPSETPYTAHADRNDRAYQYR